MSWLFWVRALKLLVLPCEIKQTSKQMKKVPQEPAFRRQWVPLRDRRNPIEVSPTTHSPESSCSEAAGGDGCNHLLLLSFYLLSLPQQRLSGYTHSHENTTWPQWNCSCCFSYWHLSGKQLLRLSLPAQRQRPLPADRFTWSTGRSAPGIFKNGRWHTKILTHFKEEC